MRARATGTIHNLSADTASIAILRDTGCIPNLVSCLRDTSPEICQAATGALQNLSREVLSRDLILQEGAVPLLTDLLFGNDIRCQVCTCHTYDINYSLQY